MRTVTIEWRHEWEYVLLFKLDDKITDCVYTQSVNMRLIDSWIKFGNRP